MAEAVDGDDDVFVIPPPTRTFGFDWAKGESTLLLLLWVARWGGGALKLSPPLCRLCCAVPDV